MAIQTLLRRGAGLLGFLSCLVFFTPAPTAAGGVYFVKPGDSLNSVSRLFRVNVDRIREANHLGTAEIRPGDRIRIPDNPAKSGPRAEVSRPGVGTDQIPQPLPAKPEPLPEVSQLHDVGSDPLSPAQSSKPEPPDVVSQRREVSSERVLQALCRNETVYHSIAKGDTLYALAIRYNTDLDNLLQLNGLRKNARLAIGQKIIVRKSGPRTHTVRRGETLFGIASRYSVGVEAIARWNKIEGAGIKAGQQLLIEPCDLYAAAGSTPPPLGRKDPVVQVTGKLSATTADSSPLISQRVIKLARTMLNVPYRFGGSTLRGIDCSAFVQRVFGLVDVRIPRTAREQYSIGSRIARGDVQIGDLVFFRTYASFPSHVGIYVGENLFIHASSMVHRVTIDSMDRPYYHRRFIGARRLIDDSVPAVASTP